MTYLANYRKAVKTAIEVLEDYEIPQAPVDLGIIFNALSREVAVKTYYELMKATDMTRDQVIDAFNSNMGVCCYDSTTSRYLIYYNEALSEPWTRFTLAHELGHIFLEHHQLAGTDILNRQFISNEDYEEYEKEANAFARNFLSPAPLAWEVIDGGNSRNQDHDIQMAFDVTERAANMRVSYIRRDLKDYSDTMKKAVKKIHIRYHRYCGKCKSYLPSDAKYCIICGNSRLSKHIIYKPLPPIIKADKNGFFEQCPQCGNADVSENSRYCMICGTPLRNACLGNSRDGKTHRRHLNLSCSKFCAECGSQTLYNYRNIKIKEEDSEVKYTDGVEYDEQSLRVKRCPVCNNDEFSGNAEFCRICGTDLYNMCEGEMDQDNWGNAIHINTHANPSNARFCETCGKPTYFSQKGILIDYENYQRKQAEAEAFASQVDGWLSIPDEDEPIPASSEQAQQYIQDQDLPFN